MTRSDARWQEKIGALRSVGNTTNPRRALILLHGRGATAASMIDIVPLLALPDDVVVLVPQALGNTWYPERFLAPRGANRPFLDQSLQKITDCIAYLSEGYGIEATAVVLAGFSQGACLTAEFLKQYPKRYLGVAVWSGGLIGDEQDIREAKVGSMEGTPVYLGCDQHDQHIPAPRVKDSAAYFRQHDALVTCQLYDGLGHTIHQDGLSFVHKCYVSD